MNDKSEEIFRIAKSIIEKATTANKEETQKGKKNKSYASEEVHNFVGNCSRFLRNYQDVSFSDNNGIGDIIYTALNSNFDKIKKEYDTLKVKEQGLNIKDAEHNFNNAKKTFDKLKKEYLNKYSKNITNH